VIRGDVTFQATTFLSLPALLINFRREAFNELPHRNAGASPLMQDSDFARFDQLIEDCTTDAAEIPFTCNCDEAVPSEAASRGGSSGFALRRLLNGDGEFTSDTSRRANISPDTNFAHSPTARDFVAWIQ
jgi:hypothetical protein